MLECHLVLFALMLYLFLQAIYDFCLQKVIEKGGGWKGRDTTELFWHAASVGSSSLSLALSAFGFYGLWIGGHGGYTGMLQKFYIFLSRAQLIFYFFVVVCYLVCILSVLTKTACLFFVQLTTINKAGNPFFVFVLGILDLRFLYFFVHFCKVYIYNRILLVS